MGGFFHLRQRGERVRRASNAAACLGERASINDDDDCAVRRLELLRGMGVSVCLPLGLSSLPVLPSGQCFYCSFFLLWTSGPWSMVLRRRDLLPLFSEVIDSTESQKR
jgi:hypothetical protein